MALEFKYMSQARDAERSLRQSILAFDCGEMTPELEYILKDLRNAAGKISRWIDDNAGKVPDRPYIFVVTERVKNDGAPLHCTYSEDGGVNRCGRETDWAIEADEYDDLLETAQKLDKDTWFMRAVCPDCSELIEEVINTGTYIPCEDCSGPADRYVKRGISSKTRHYLCQADFDKSWPNLRRRNYMSFNLKPWQKSWQKKSYKSEKYRAIRRLK